MKKIFSKLSNKELESTTKDKEIFGFFRLPPLKPNTNQIPSKNNHEYQNWIKQNVIPHKIQGYSIVQISLKAPKKPPGDATSNQMLALAEISDKFSFSEIKVHMSKTLFFLMYLIRNYLICGINLKFKT
ncbi:MAG: hypothetical protein CM15mP40_03350 [Alphaproteobacteria bacterium]|nr:MAG: hypothetical protein CM15mP40_03350 [Alphaproteobacteria bacterium]